MIVYSGKEKLNITENTVVTIGKFDGMHKGHQKLISRMQDVSVKENLNTVLFTFDISPAAYLNKYDRKFITTDIERIKITEDSGIDYFVSYPFTEAVRCMSGEEFISKVLVDELHAKYIVVGTDFKFGHNRTGDVALLKALSCKYGYQLIVEEKHKNNKGSEISSTLIRSLVREGDMEGVYECLGRPYSIKGEVIHGNHMGTSFGIPTINQRPDETKLLPPRGVYVSKVNVDGKVYGGITNIGCKPTVGENSIGVETFLFDFEGDIYGACVETNLLKFVRTERKFASVEELTAQINRDAAFGREYLNSYS